MPAISTLKKWPFAQTHDSYVPMVAKMGEEHVACVGVRRRAGGLLLAVPSEELVGALLDDIMLEDANHVWGPRLALQVRCGAAGEDEGDWEDAALLVLDCDDSVAPFL